MLLTDRDHVQLLRAVDRAEAALKRETAGMPRALVWHCKTTEQMYALRSHFLLCINDWRKRLPGKTNRLRNDLLTLIEQAERELREIDAVLFSLTGK